MNIKTHEELRRQNRGLTIFIFILIGLVIFLLLGDWWFHHSSMQQPN